MFTIITNHYLPQITPINPSIIHFKIITYITSIPFLKLSSNFSQNDNVKTWREHTKKSFIDNTWKLGIYTQ